MATIGFSIQGARTESAQELIEASLCFVLALLIYDCEQQVLVMFDEAPKRDSFDAIPATSQLLSFSLPQYQSARVLAVSAAVTFMVVMIQTTRRQDCVEAGDSVFQNFLKVLPSCNLAKYIVADVKKLAAGSVCMCQSSRSVASLVVSFCRCDSVPFLSFG